MSSFSATSTTSAVLAAAVVSNPFEFPEFGISTSLVQPVSGRRMLREASPAVLPESDGSAVSSDDCEDTENGSGKGKGKGKGKKGEGKGEGKSGADINGDGDVKPDEEAEDFVANFGSAVSGQKRRLNTEGQIDFPKNGTDDSPAHHGHHGHHGKKHCGHHRRHHKSIFGTANQDLFGTRFPVLETSILALVMLSVLACLLRRGSPLRKLLSKCASKHRRGGSRNNRDFGSGASGRSATTSETTTQQAAATASLDETSDADSQTSETTPRKPRGDNNTTAAPVNDGQNDGPSRTISTRSVFSAGAASSGAGDSTSRTAYPQVVVVTTADEGQQGQQVLYQQPTTAVIQTLQGQAALSTPAPRPVPVVFSQNISH